MLPMIETLLALTAGGVAGTLSRFAVARLLPLPWATLTVNLSGCLLIGLFDAAASRRGMGPQGRALLMAGFCGAYTTFSALILELDALLRVSPLRGTAYLALSVAAGLALFRAGGVLAGRLG